MADDPPSTPPPNEAPRYTAQEWAALQAQRDAPRYTPEEWAAMQAQAVIAARAYHARGRRSGWRREVRQAAIAVLIAAGAIAAVVAYKFFDVDGHGHSQTTAKTPAETADSMEAVTTHSDLFCALDRSRAGQCWSTARECDIESFGASCSASGEYFCFDYLIPASGAARRDCFMHADECVRRRANNPDELASKCLRYKTATLSSGTPEKVDWGPQVTPAPAPPKK